jgi:hypothetical protein
MVVTGLCGQRSAAALDHRRSRSTWRMDGTSALIVKDRCAPTARSGGLRRAGEVLGMRAVEWI